MTPFRMRPLGILTCAALLGCENSAPSDATTPRVEATFLQETLDSMAVPFSVSHDGACANINIGGLLTLYPSGRYTLILDRVRQVCTDNSGGGGSQGLEEGRYIVKGDSIVFTRHGASRPSLAAFLFYSSTKDEVITEGGLYFTVGSHGYIMATDPALGTLAPTRSQ